MNITGSQYERLTAGNFMKSVITLNTSREKSLFVVELDNIKYFEKHSKFLLSHSNNPTLHEDKKCVIIIPSPSTTD